LDTPPADRRQTRAEEDPIVSDTLINLTDAADTALGAFDFSAHEGKGVRVFLQGFG
jgi:hypothetical protein